MQEKILVTGATGFAGGVLTTKLVELGHNVRILARKTGKYKRFEEMGCEVIFGDLASGEGIEESVKGVSKVYHIGAAFRVEGVPKQYFWDVNVEGTRLLLEASLKYGVRRFVHCSTVGVHGEIKKPPAAEDAPLAPGDHYQKSKLEGERLALSYVKKGLGVVVFRPLGIYGPGDMRFLKLFKPIAKGKWFTVGKANNLYHLTHVNDLVRGIILCGTVKDIVGEVFILGGAKYSTVRELGMAIAKCLESPLRIYALPVFPVWSVAFLCEIICRLIHVEPPIFRRRLDFFLKDRAFDISKAREKLGYEPQVSLDAGLRETAKWYKGKKLI